MYRAGVDIGGMSIKMGILDERTMEVVWKREIANPKMEYRELCRAVRDEIAASGYAESIRALGAAVPGEVDPEAGVVGRAYNLGFRDVPLRAELAGLFDAVPVSLCNDADAAVVAEVRHGALAGTQVALLLTIGKGVGGGIVLNGDLFKGGGGHSSEPGHMLLRYGGKPCTCGARGCVEAYCAATRLAADGQRAQLGNTAKDVFDAVARGDCTAREILAAYIDDLAAAIASMANLLDPEIVVIGGGISAAGDSLFKPLQAAVNEKTFARRTYRVIPVANGNNAGFIGAALL